MRSGVDASVLALGGLFHLRINTGMKSYCSIIHTVVYHKINGAELPSTISLAAVTKRVLGRINLLGRPC